VDLVRLLLDKGADALAEAGGLVPLDLAAKNGHASATALLFRAMVQGDTSGKWLEDTRRRLEGMGLTMPPPF
jgi:hypothetical protein